MRPDWCFLAPGDQLHVNRLRYAKRLVQHCPGLVYCGIFCTTSVNAPDSWIGSLRTSLAWLVQRYGASKLPSPEANLEEWWSLIALADRWYGFHHTYKSGLPCLQTCSCPRAGAGERYWESASAGRCPGRAGRSQAPYWAMGAWEVWDGLRFKEGACRSCHKSS